MRSDSTDLRGLRPGLLGLAVVCALGAMQAQAVGLGGIEVKSKLNEPFVAEIPLDVDYSGQMDDMVVHLASPEEFERVGLERPHEMSANLTFHLTRNARGEAVVLVTTPQKMTDPYVSFLLEAEWGNGKMVREYTALLEPPHMVEVPHDTISAPTVASTPLPAPVVTAPVAHAVEPEAQPASPGVAAPPPVAQSMPEPVAAATQAVAPAPPPVAAAPEPEPASPPPPSVAPEPAPPPVAETPPPVEEVAPPPTASPDSVTVGRGQTLSSIAGQMQAPGVSLNRMMIALQRANPEAFVGDNINRLKAGVVLRVPDAGQMQAITPDEANALVHEQVESWRRGAQPAPQLQPEQASGDAAKQTSNGAASASGEGVTTAKGGAPAAAVAGAAHAGKGRGAHLEILPPAGNVAGQGQSGSSEGGSGSELRAQLAQTKEELGARRAEITDLKAHVADLEKIKTDSQKLLSMKDSQLAALQQRLAELEKKDAEAAASPASPASTASLAITSGASPEASASTAASATSETTTGASPASTASGASSTAASTAATPVPAASPKKPAVPAHHATPPPQEPATPWFLQPFVLIGAGLILFGGLLGLLLRSQRKPEASPRRRSFDPAALPNGRPIVSPNAITEQQVVFPDAAGQRESAPPPVEPAPVEPAPVEVAPAPAAAIQPPPGGKWTVASRIEAARAYIENGDVDGARTMLEAALIEGNATQQEEAFKLLDMIDSW